MNSQFYFEENPWKHVESVIRQEQQNVHQVVVQSVCERGSLDAALEKWKTAIECLAGDQVRGSVIRRENAVSFVGIFGNNTIVRIFLDDAARDISDNFEIITDKELYIWKPVSTNQGHLLTTDSENLQSSQEFVEDLAVIG